MYGYQIITKHLAYSYRIYKFFVLQIHTIANSLDIIFNETGCSCYSPTYQVPS